MRHAWLPATAAVVAAAVTVGIVVSATGASGASGGAGTAVPAATTPTGSIGLVQPEASVASRSYASLPADSAPVELTIVLTPSSRTQLRALADAKHAWTARQRAAALAATAPTTTARATVSSALAAAGFTLLQSGQWDLRVSAPPATVEKYFAVGFVGSGNQRHATRTPTLPAALGGNVTAVLGLDQRAVFKPLTQTAPIGSAPSDLREAYGLGTQTSDTGLGATVATVQFSGWDRTDLDHYAQTIYPSGQPPVQLTEVPVDNANPRVSDNGGDLEVSIDQEMIYGAAPNAQQRAYFAPNGLAGSYDLYSRIAADVAGANITAISTSWGFCQSGDSPDFGYETAVADAIARAVASGATMFAASGDSGANDCGVSDNPNTSVNESLDVDFPAVLPQVVAVGGTTLSKPAAVWLESAWNGDDGASGGGVSRTTSRPAYQSSIGLTGSTRVVPDISATADASSTRAPFAYYASSGASPYIRAGGTSVGSPLMAGLFVARLSDSSFGCGTGIGDIHAALYSHTDGSHFRDITSGDNRFPAGAAGYTTRVGYDAVTGLGSPLWGAFTAAQLLPGGVCPMAVTTAALAPGDRLLAGAALSVQLTASGNPSPSVVWSLTGGTHPGFSLNSSGLLTGSNATPGTYTFTVTAVSGATTVIRNYTLTVYSPYGRFFPVPTAQIFAGTVGTAPAIVNVANRGGIPPSATAVIANVTVQSPTTASGYVKVVPYKRDSTTSVQQLTGHQTVSNLVTVALVNGAVQVNLSSGTGRVLIDVYGYYAASTSGSTFHPLPVNRIFDKTVSTVPYPVNVVGVAGQNTAALPVPANATAVVVNVEVVNPPVASNLRFSAYKGNTTGFAVQTYAAHQTISNMAVVPLLNGAAQVRIGTGTARAIVDVLGYFTPDATGVGYQPLTTTTRLFQGLLSTQTQSVDFSSSTAIDLRAKAVVVNVTVYRASAAGYLRATPAGQDSYVSSQEFVAGQTIATLVTVGLNGGKADLKLSGGNAIVFLDVAGYYY
jgi:kumamolisin